MSSYTNIFSGTLLQPSTVSYAAIPLSSNVQLAWPTDFNSNPSAVILAAIMDVTPTGNGFSLILPNSTNVSVGTAFSINNISPYTFTLLANDGITPISVIGAATFSTFYLINNTTANGAYRQTFTAGVTGVVSVAASTAPSAGNLTVTGSPITTAGTLSFGLGADLASLTSFGNAVGISARTAANTWSLVTLTGSANINVTNPNGVGGNPTISLSTTLTGLTSIGVGNLSLFGNTITTTNVGGNIVLYSNSTGSVIIGPLPNVNFTVPPITNSLVFPQGGANTGYTSFSVGNMGTNEVQYILPTSAPTTGQVLSAVGVVNPFSLSWATVAITPGVTTPTAIARYSNATGGLENSGVLLDNSNNITGVNNLTAAGFIQASNLQIGGPGASANIIASTSGSIILSPNGTNIVQIGVTGGTNTALRFFNNAGFYNSFAADVALSTNVSFLWPTRDALQANLPLVSDATGKLSFSSALVSGVPSSGVVPAIGTHTFYNASNTNFLRLTVGATSSSYTITFPVLPPTNGYTFVSDGSGILTWQPATGGTVTSVSQGTGITCTPNPIVGAGTVAITNTGVAAATYQFPQIVLNAQGQATSAINLGYESNISGPGGGNLNLGFGAGNGASTTGPSNVVIGYQAGSAMTTATQSVAIGYQAMQLTTTAAAASNIAIGYQAYKSATIGNNNVMMGNLAGSSTISGTFNVGMGNFVFQNLNSAGNDNSNVAIGHNTCQSRTSYTECVYIGHNADSSVNVTNVVAVGQSSVVSANFASALGHDAFINTNATNSLALGSGTTVIAGASYACAIGSDSVASLPNVMALGGTTLTNFTYVGIGNSSPAYSLQLGKVSTNACAIYLANTAANTPAAPAANDGTVSVQAGVFNLKGGTGAATGGLATNPPTATQTTAAGTAAVSGTPIVFPTAAYDVLLNYHVSVVGAVANNVTVQYTVGSSGTLTAANTIASLTSYVFTVPIYVPANITGSITFTFTAGSISYGTVALPI